MVFTVIPGVAGRVNTGKAHHNVEGSQMSACSSMSMSAEPRQQALSGLSSDEGAMRAVFPCLVTTFRAWWGFAHGGNDIPMKREDAHDIGY